MTNGVQRQILDLLRVSERQLPELVELTGRSKPTLSSLHMKELLARELISEAPHPTDSRRKVYRLRAQKIGSSDLPVDQLKAAVAHYVTLAPAVTRLPLAAAFEAIAAAPEGTPDTTLKAQAKALGRLGTALLRASDARDLWLRLAPMLESERLATLLRVDVQHGAIELRLGPAHFADARRSATMLAAFVEGAADGRGLGVGSVRGRLTKDGVRIEVA